MTLAYTVLIGLASFRLWRFIAIDDITARPGEWILARSPEWFGKMVRCGWCLGSWVAFGVTWGVDVVAGLRLPVLVGLAAAVIVGWLAEQI